MRSCPPPPPSAPCIWMKQRDHCHAQCQCTVPRCGAILPRALIVLACALASPHPWPIQREGQHLPRGGAALTGTGDEGPLQPIRPEAGAVEPAAPQPAPSVFAIAMHTPKLFRAVDKSRGLDRPHRDSVVKCRALYARPPHSHGTSPLFQMEMHCLGTREAEFP